MELPEKEEKGRWDEQNIGDWGGRIAKTRGKRGGGIQNRREGGDGIARIKKVGLAGGLRIEWAI